MELSKIVWRATQGLLFLLYLFEARRTEDALLFFVTFTATCLASGSPYVVDRHLRQRRDPGRMSRHHIGLAAAFSVAIIGVVASLLQ